MYKESYAQLIMTKIGRDGCKPSVPRVRLGLVEPKFTHIFIVHLICELMRGYGKFLNSRSTSGFVDRIFALRRTHTKAGFAGGPWYCGGHRFGPLVCNVCRCIECKKSRLLDGYVGTQFCLYFLSS